MTTNFPGSEDSFTRPIPGDPLASSGGKASTVIVDDLQDAVEALEAINVGPAFVNAKHYAAVAETVLNAGTSATGFVAVNGTGVSVDGSQSSPGSPSSSIKASSLGTTWDNNIGLASKFYLNDSTGFIRGTRSHIAIDVRFQYVVSGYSFIIPDVFEAFAADGVDVTGTVTTRQLPAGLGESTWATIYLDVRSLSLVRSVGVRTIATSSSKPAGKANVWIDNVRWAAQTEIDVAMESGATVLVPASYTPSVTPRPIAVPRNRGVVDLRGMVAIMANEGGRMHVRQFVDIDETGATMVAAKIQGVLDCMQDNDTLYFSGSSALYWADDPFNIPSRTNITIDAQGARFFTKQNRGYSWWNCTSPNGLTMRNGAIFGYRQDTRLGNLLTTVAGTPAISGSVVQLDAIGESVRYPVLDYFARDETGVVKFDAVLSQSATSLAAPNDCRIEIVDADAPTLPPTLVAGSGTGSLKNQQYWYRYSWFDAEGNETGPSPAASITLATYNNVTVTVAVPPVRQSCPYVGTRVYRTTDFNAVGEDISVYHQVADIASPTVTTLFDNFADGQATSAPNTFVLAQGAAGNVPAGQHGYQITYVYGATGRENTGTGKSITLTADSHILLTAIPGVWNGTADPTTDLITTTTPHDFSNGQQVTIAASSTPGGLNTATTYFARQVASNQLSLKLATTNSDSTIVDITSAGAGLQLSIPGVTARRIYRALAGNASAAFKVHFLAQINDITSTTYDDNIADSAIATNANAPDPVGGRKPLQFASQVLTLDGTPRTYTLRWEPGEGLRAMITCRVVKATSIANIITVGSITGYGQSTYSASNSPYDGRPIETSHGFNLGNANHVLIENWWVEGVGGDHTNITGNDITVRDCLSRCCRRQGMSDTDGEDHLLDNVRIWEPARTGFDAEPTGAGVISRLTIRNMEVRNANNAAVSCNGWNSIVDLDVDGLKVSGPRDVSWGFLGGALGMRISRVHSPYAQLILKGTNIVYDDIVCKRLTFADETVAPLAGHPEVRSGGHSGSARVTTTRFDAPITAEVDTAMMQMTQMGRASDFPVNGANVSAPFDMSADSVYGLADPGVYRRRFPNTYKALALGQVYYPQGLDLRETSVKRSRGISSTSTPANNLGGTVAINAGDTTKTVNFPTHPYTNPTSFSLNAVTVAGGTVPSSTTQRVRVAGRTRAGGPIVALGELPIAMGANNTINVKVFGFQQALWFLEGITIYRGGAIGIYTARYDIVPNVDPTGDFAGFGSDGSAGSVDQFTFQDTGAAVGAVSGGIYVGYTFPFGLTSPTNHAAYDIANSKWVVQDETGWEADLLYRLSFGPSWDTTVSWTAKRNNGFDMRFGVACPAGGGTIDWGLIRA